MKHGFLLLLVLLLTVASAASADFSASSAVYDPDLADMALNISELCYLPSVQSEVLATGGYRLVGVFNADRDPSDTRHVATYSLYDRTPDGGRTEVIIAVRGTGQGEWKLNMELMPSGNFDLPYAENFVLAAEDVLSTQAAYLDSLNDPCFLVTGFSRGAAVANILGARLTDRYQPENVFVYTFATPRTVRGEVPAYGNIFNIINPADVIPRLPFPQWGFERYGTDLLLPVDDPSLQEAAEQAYAQRPNQSGAYVSPQGKTEAAEQLIAVLASIAETPADGYCARHAFAHPGFAAEDEPGMTPSEFMLQLFDGSLLSARGDSSPLAQMSGAENDFTPVLAALQRLQTGDGASWFLAMHLPGTYGAWLPFLK